MTFELENKKLHEVIELIIDNRGRNPKAYSIYGIPVIDNYLIISDGEVNLHEVNRFIDEETYNSFLRKYIKCGDVLMTLVGNGYGKVAITPQEKCAIIQNTIGLRCNKDNCNQFLYYLLRNNRELLMNLNRGAAQPSIKVGDVLALEFEFPSFSNQERIARILGTMDKKIQINRQTNQTLEQIAQTIFKSWFVDFDPVKAKIAVLEAGGTQEAAEMAAMCVISGKDEAQLAQLKAQDLDAYQQLVRTAALFPTAMQESELGDIPEGWNTKPLDSIAHYQNGLALQKFRPEDDSNYLPIVKIADLKKGIADHTEKASPDIKPTSIIDNGDVVFSWSGSLMVDIWCGGKAALNQHLFKVTSDKYPKWFFHLFTKHHLEEFQRIAAAKAVTMGHIKKEHLTQAICVVPCDDILLVGNKVIGSLIDKQIKLRLENNVLTELRDSLLPKLLSGEISITDLEGSQKELTE